MNKLFWIAAIAALTGFLGCGGREASQPAAGGAKSLPPSSKASYAFITNGVAAFWDIAKQGANKAGSELDVNVDVIMPSSMTDQTRKIEDLLTRGTDGIAISPKDPANQVEILNKAAGATNLITQD